MRKKKKKKPRQNETHPLTPDEKSDLNRLLEDLDNLEPSRIDVSLSNVPVARAFIEQLPVDHPKSSEFLKAVFDAFGDKEVRKAVKKVLFRLKQKGISVPELNPDEKTPQFTISREIPEPIASLGPVDGFGGRAVFIALPQAPTGFDVGLGIVSDEQGIIEFYFGRYSKKKMNEVKDLFLSNVGFVVDASIAHAATILETAYGCNAAGENESSNDYHQLRPWILEHVILLDRPPVYEFIPVETISRDILTPSQIDKMLDHEFFSSWIIDLESIKSLAEEIKEAENSPILVAEDQKSNRINELKEKGISKLFPEEKRALIKSRLEEWHLSSINPMKMNLLVWFSQPPLLWRKRILSSK